MTFRASQLFDLLDLGFGDIPRENARDTSTVVVDLEHNPTGLRLGFGEEASENHHNELHGGVVVVVQDDGEPSRLSHLTPRQNG